MVERLGIDRLEIGPYQEPGMARATALVGSETVGLSLKSGKLGPSDMFERTLRSMLDPEG